MKHKLRNFRSLNAFDSFLQKAIHSANPLCCVFLTSLNCCIYSLLDKSNWKINWMNTTATATVCLCAYVMRAIVYGDRTKNSVGFSMLRPHTSFNRHMGLFKCFNPAVMSPPSHTGVAFIRPVGGSSGGIFPFIGNEEQRLSLWH